MRNAMKLCIPAACAAAMISLMPGCGTFRHVAEKPSATTGPAEDREERVAAAVADLKAKGYSEDHAKSVASREFPLIETTYSESLWSILTGARQKQTAEKELLQKELVKAARDTPPPAP